LATDSEIAERIVFEAQEGLTLLKPHLRSWASEHLIRPRRVSLSVNSEGTSFKSLWLVTDHLGKDDSSYRIVYDEDESAFGLELTLDMGVEWYMGIYGTFSETVENM
jgi:hypothetical protein